MKQSGRTIDSPMDSPVPTVMVVRSQSPRQIQAWHVQLGDVSISQPCTVAQILAHINLVDARQMLQDGWSLGIWSQACNLTTCVIAGDRIELYRPLRVDPKLARRERFAKQGSRVAGLFRL